MLCCSVAPTGIQCAVIDGGIGHCIGVERADGDGIAVLQAGVEIAAAGAVQVATNSLIDTVG